MFVRIVFAAELRTNKSNIFSFKLKLFLFNIFKIELKVMSNISIFNLSTTNFNLSNSSDTLY